MNEHDLGARLISEGLVAPVPLEKVNRAKRNSFEAIHDFELEIEDTEFPVLVGPSGFGTSTALRMIASLEASSTVGQDAHCSGSTRRSGAVRSAYTVSIWESR